MSNSPAINIESCPATEWSNYAANTSKSSIWDLAEKLFWLQDVSCEKALGELGTVRVVEDMKNLTAPFFETENLVTDTCCTVLGAHGIYWAIEMQVWRTRFRL